jgi:hypothetical protein
MSGCVLPRHSRSARSAEVFVGFPRLGGKYFVLLARKDGDLAPAGPFKPNVHDTCFSLVDLSAVADGNDGDRSGVLDEDNPPIANAKPATLGALPRPNLRSPNDKRSIKIAVNCRTLFNFRDIDQRKALSAGRIGEWIVKRDYFQ